MFHRRWHPYHIGLKERKDQRFKDTCFKTTAVHMFNDIKAYKIRM